MRKWGEICWRGFRLYGNRRIICTSTNKHWEVGYIGEGCGKVCFGKQNGHKRCCRHDRTKIMSVTISQANCLRETWNTRYRHLLAQTRRDANARAQPSCWNYLKRFNIYKNDLINSPSIPFPLVSIMLVSFAPKIIPRALPGLPGDIQANLSSRTRNRIT